MSRQTGATGATPVFAITSTLPRVPRLKILDIGAMKLKERSDYDALLKAVPCEVIGFEPVTGELERLRDTKTENERYLPYFVGDGSTRTFHECNYPMTSSLFEPNTPLVAKFQNLEQFMRVVKTYSVQTTRLDDLPEVRGTDFLKVDVQGAELMVFRGGVKTLGDVLVIQTEVEFVPLYKDQPLFADIDAFLRERGFQFHKIGLAGRPFKPLMVDNNPNALMSQVLWGDAIYVRDFMTFDRLGPTALLKLACIVHEVYRSYDLAAVALEAYDRQEGTQVRQAYLERLTASQS
jgi:FkbM family methyltransferase